MSVPARQGRLAWVPRVIWVALSVAIIAAAWNAPWHRVLEQARSVRLAWIVAALAVNAAILPLWAAEWRLLVPRAFRVAYGRMFEIVSVTASVLNTIPFLAGEASAVALLMVRGGLTRGAALSVLALDQLLVAIVKVLVIGAAAAVLPLPSWLRAGIISLVLAAAALLLVLLVLAHRGGLLHDWLLRRASPLRERAARVVAWGTQLELLRDARRATLAAAIATAKKGAELTGVVCIQMAFGLEPSIPHALVVLAALSVTTLLPLAPANLGVYEATVFAAYRALGMPTETAIGLALVQHFCFLLPSVATGYALATGRQLLRRRVTAT